MATCRHHLSQMLDVLTFSSQLFLHDIEEIPEVPLEYEYDIFSCVPMFEFCVRQRPRERSIIPHFQQKSSAKTYPPKDSKRSEENGKKTFNFFSGVFQMSLKEAKLLNSALVIFDS